MESMKLIIQLSCILFAFIEPTYALASLSPAPSRPAPPPPNLHFLCARCTAASHPVSKRNDTHAQSSQQPTILVSYVLFGKNCSAHKLCRTRELGGWGEQQMLPCSWWCLLNRPCMCGHGQGAARKRNKRAVNRIRRGKRYPHTKEGRGRLFQVREPPSWTRKVWETCRRLKEWTR
jgi:hypothetical protein